MEVEFPGSRVLASLQQGRDVLHGANLEVEPPEVGMAVERHRWAWRPAEPKVLMIAESHVYTSPNDVRLRIDSRLLPTAAQHAPAEYVRLIYCLGYGESRILNSVPEGRNSGTPQFWNIFGRVAGTGRQPTTLQASWQQRLDWKVRTLVAMRERGVWLLDASLHGIYAPGAERVGPAVSQELHRIWCRTYGGWLLEQWPKAYRCVIGRGVARTLESLGVRFNSWIYQPQARAGTGVDLEAGWNELMRVSGARLQAGLR
jgi:hypothetical protein